jgi:hypothetical protein
MTRSLAGSQRVEAMALPGWIKPQLTKLVDQAPDGPEWLHELKFDGYPTPPNPSARLPEQSGPGPADGQRLP